MKNLEDMKKWLTFALAFENETNTRAQHIERLTIDKK